MLLAIITYLYFVLGKIDNILGIFIWGYITAIVASLVVLSLIYLLEGDNYSFKEAWEEKYPHLEKNFFNYIKNSPILNIIYPKTFIFMLILSSLYPQKDELKWVLGAYVTYESIEYLQESKEIKKLPDNVVKVANSFLEDLSKQKLLKHNKVNSKEQ